MATEAFYTESGNSPPSRKESDRKYRESHRAQRRAYDRKRQQLAEVKARRNETARQRHELKVLAQAKGKSLRSNFTKAARPKMLTRLILQEAEWVCEFWGISQDQKWDTNVLRQAASHIRDFPFYPIRHFELGESINYVRKNGLTHPTNPWYCTDYLHESTITKKHWAYGFRARARAAQWRAKQEAQKQQRIESGEELDYDALLASLKAQEVK